MNINSISALLESGKSLACYLNEKEQSYVINTSKRLDITIKDIEILKGFAEKYIQQNPNTSGDMREIAMNNKRNFFLKPAKSRSFWGVKVFKKDSLLGGSTEVFYCTDDKFSTSQLQLQQKIKLPSNCTFISFEKVEVDEYGNNKNCARMYNCDFEKFN